MASTSSTMTPALGITRGQTSSDSSWTRSPGRPSQRISDLGARSDRQLDRCAGIGYGLRVNRTAYDHTGTCRGQTNPRTRERPHTLSPAASRLSGLSIGIRILMASARSTPVGRAITASSPAASSWAGRSGGVHWRPLERTWLSTSITQATAEVDTLTEWSSGPGLTRRPARCTIRGHRARRSAALGKVRPMSPAPSSSSPSCRTMCAPRHRIGSSARKRGPLQFNRAIRSPPKPWPR